MIGDALEPRLPLTNRSLPTPAWAVAGTAAALAVGSAASVSPTAGIAVAIGIAAAAAIVAHRATILFILAASVLIEQVRVEGSTISRVLAPIALVAVLVELLRGRASIRPASPLVWTVAYGLWALASGLWTTSVAGTVTELSSLAIAAVYMLSFASLLDSRRDLRRVLWALAFASFLLGALSFRHVSETLGLGVLLQGGRSQGGVGDPNYFAATQLVVLPVIVVLAGEARKRLVQLALYGMVLVVMGSILTSLSRGGFIGLAVLLVLLVFAPFHLLFRSRRSKAIVLVVITLGVTALSIQSFSTLAERVGPLFQTTNPAAQQGSGRVELWKAARASIEKHPWLGLGYGSFPKVSGQLLLNTPGVDLSHYPLRTKGAPAHNTYLESFADLGILGPVLYLGLLISTGLVLKRQARQAREAGSFFVGNVAGALLLGLVTWSITSIFLSTETSRTLWIVIGLSLALPKLVALGGADQEEHR